VKHTKAGAWETGHCGKRSTRSAEKRNRSGGVKRLGCPGWRENHIHWTILPHPFTLHPVRKRGERRSWWVCLLPPWPRSQRYTRTDWYGSRLPCFAG